MRSHPEVLTPNILTKIFSGGPLLGKGATLKFLHLTFSLKFSQGGSLLGKGAALKFLHLTFSPRLVRYHDVLNKRIYSLPRLTLVVVCLCPKWRLLISPKLSVAPSLETLSESASEGLLLVIGNLLPTPGPIST
jgi:hypothetical protein